MCSHFSCYYIYIVKKAVAISRFSSYKEMQGKFVAEAVTFFILLRIRKVNQNLKGKVYGYEKEQRRNQREIAESPQIER